MIDRIVEYSIRERGLVIFLAIAVAAGAFYYASSLPIDAVPDITTNQIQINALAPGFAPREMEQYVTAPIEMAVASLPEKEEIRSLSQPGLSQITITLHDNADLYRARQLALERLAEARESLPDGVTVDLSPISTGLGEIFQFTVENGPGGTRSLMELRTILDWEVKPLLRTVPGVIEVNTYGGVAKQYQVSVDPAKLVRHQVKLAEIIKALSENNQNAGGAYLERNGEQQLIRGVGLIQHLADIENIVVRAAAGTPLLVRDLATVEFGQAIRQGAATMDGKGEVAIGVAMLLKGENSRIVAGNVRNRLLEAGKSMPPNVMLKPFYDRTDLVNRTIGTAAQNLVEGGVLVAGILLLFLLQWRAGLIVASVIPVSMLIAAAGMRYFGVSANLMSLGAIDFGLIVDAAVIMVENSVRRLSEHRAERQRRLTNQERLGVIASSSLEVRRASQFGEIIIIAAYLPILALAGLEGKMFHPMAFSVILALCAALVLSLTLVPALSAVFLKDKPEPKNAVLDWLRAQYEPMLHWVLDNPGKTAVTAALFVAISAAGFTTLGSEFIPELDEGAIAMSQVRPKSIALAETVRQVTQVEKSIMELPEVASVVSRIGRPEIATDPMGPDLTDSYIFLKPEAQWRGAAFKNELLKKIAARTGDFAGLAVSFSQPVKFRMMELIEGLGSRSDVVVKIFGDDPAVLTTIGNGIAAIAGKVTGAQDVKVQQLAGLPTLSILIDRAAISRLGLNGSDVQSTIRTAIAGTKASVVLEGFVRADLVVRFQPSARQTAADLANLPVVMANGQSVPLGQLARIVEEEGPAEISRENGQQRLTVEMNVRERDIGSFVEEARRVSSQVNIPPGYRLEWGGTYEHLQSGRQRLMIAVPVTFALILLMLFATFDSLREALLVFTGIPFAASGGVLALLLRDMPFSISAGVGFIAVSGVAVLNGVVMLSSIRRYREEGQDAWKATVEGALTRLRPVLMTATVASLGFVPMAVSTGTGAEVQRPIATVVIGGLLTSTILTLMVLPALYLRIAGPGQPSVPPNPADNLVTP